MVFFNYATMQMAAKIVYYGPGLCGKTTNLHQIYAKTAPQSRGEMVSLETETDRTLFFDLLPIDVGVIGGFKTRLQLYTVPGQVFYNTTRKLVLKGVDGIVFVADSQTPALESNVESLRNLRENLTEIGLDMDEIPLVIQLNKRDLPNIVPVDTMLGAMDPERKFEHVEAIAASGQGVFETLKLISKLTLRQLRSRMSGDEPVKPAPRPRAGAGVAEFRVKNAGDEVSPMRTIAATTPIPDLADAVAATPQPAQETPASATAAAETQAPAAVETLIASEPEVEVTPASAPFEESVESGDGGSLEDLLSSTAAEPEAPEEPAFSLDDESGPTTQYIPPATAPEPAPVEMPVEVPQPVAAAPVPEPEVDFSRAETPAKPEPEVKHVKVRSSVDVMAELESLRKKATQPVTKGKKDVTADLSALVGKRDLTKNVALSVPSDTLARTKALRVTLSFDDDQGVVHTEDRVIELKDPSDVQTLLVNLKIERS